MYNELSRADIENYADTYFAQIKNKWLDKEPYTDSTELLESIKDQLGCGEEAAAEIVYTIVDERIGELFGMRYRASCKGLEGCFCIDPEVYNKLINGELDHLLN